MVSHYCLENPCPVCIAAVWANLPTEVVRWRMDTGRVLTPRFVDWRGDDDD